MPYSAHPIFQDPPENWYLWRYISRDKFESLLDRRALFFCRADRFSDPYEGASPIRDIDHRLHVRPEIAEMIGQTFAEEAGKRNAEVLEWLQRSLRQSVIVSCWHSNSHESDAMWRLYLKDWRGVAIQTTVPRLKSSFDATDYEVYAGKVRYLDYSTDIYHDPDDFAIEGYNAMTPFIHKRRYFIHENEYRALVDLSKVNSSPAYDWSQDENQDGKFISVDLDILVERVVVPPQAEDAFVQLVEDLLKKADLEVRVVRSSMSSEPRF